MLALDEFKSIIKNYILRLLGLQRKKIDNVGEKEKLESKMIYYNNGQIYFRASANSKICCKVSVGNWYEKTKFTIEIKVLKKILEYAPNDLDQEIIIKQYNDANQKKIVYEYALEYGLCCALIENGSIDCSNIYKLISMLEQWSSKTYEGKKVPFAFVIDVEEEADKDAINYLEFLDSDFSATITDGISSIIELDCNCKFKKYLSIYDDNSLDNKILSGKMKPLRFAQILYKYVTGKRLGIFLLVNGDMLLAKNGELLYVKRNKKWINICGKRYVNTLCEIVAKSKIKEALLNSIYETTLDVSFAHSGGIIAVVDYKKFIERPIMSCVDDLNDNDYESMDEEKKKLHEKYILQIENEKNKKLDKKEKSYLDQEFDKMFSKRKVIKQLLSVTNGKKINFVEIDRKLRMELCGLDGATILDLEGNVIAFGAIIQNNRGSSGGGRGAAASRLSDFGGFATKISTDGYIELYKKKEICYQIK